MMNCHKIDNFTIKKENLPKYQLKNTFSIFKISAKQFMDTPVYQNTWRVFIFKPDEFFKNRVFIIEN